MHVIAVTKSQLGGRIVLAWRDGGTSRAAAAAFVSRARALVVAPRHVLNDALTGQLIDDVDAPTA